MPRKKTAVIFIFSLLVLVLVIGLDEAHTAQQFAGSPYKPDQALLLSTGNISQKQIPGKEITTAASVSPDVGVLAYCTDLTGIFGAQNTVNTLLADGRFGSVELVDGDVELPTAQDLLDKYDRVIAMTDSRCGEPIPKNIADSGADALAGFARSGGGLVIAAFAFSKFPDGIGLGPSLFKPGLSPFQQSGTDNEPAGPINLSDASTEPACNQLLEGVSGALLSQFANDVSLSSEATLCLSYNSGTQFLAVNKAGNIIGLNTFAANKSDNEQSGYQRLVSNAVFYAGNFALLVRDLAAVPGQEGGEVDLSWTAPADEAGNAVKKFDLRYLDAPISESNWDSAMQAVGEPAPVNPGGEQSMTVSGLPTGMRWYFALKATSDLDVSGPLSNIPSVYLVKEYAYHTFLPLIQDP